MKIAILGAGFTGLTAGYRLTKLGHEVTLFEKEERVGGLASGFKLPDWDWYLDYHYHHLFTSDKFASNLLKEIGMENDLILKKPQTKIFYQPNVIARKSRSACMNVTTKQSTQSRLLRSPPAGGSLAMTNECISAFNSPIDLLKFPHLSLIDRIRTGVVLAFLKFNSQGQNLEKITAYEWLTKYLGETAFRVLWEPLFIGKFGKEAKTISMAWFWARIYKRSTSLGYIKGGFQNLADKLAKEITKQGGKLMLNTNVLNCHCEESGTIQNLTTKQSTQKQIALPAQAGEVEKKNEIIIEYNSCHSERSEESQSEHFDKVICTLPTSTFLRVTPNLPTDYVTKLNKVQHLDCLNLILVLKERFFPDETYWLNINEVAVPFLAVVEHTNFMDKKYYGGQHLVYVGNYLPKDHEFFQKSKEELLAIFDPYLTKFNPDYKKYLVNSHLFRGNEAQPIIPVNYSKMKPDFKTPIDNLFLANMDMVYPWDRGTNYAVELGNKIVDFVNSKKQIPNYK